MDSTIQCGGWQGKLGSGLADRELACILAVASGFTDKQIAQRDGRSPRSVKGRIESAMHKLGAYKRSALVAEAMRRGLISPTAVLAMLLAFHGVMADDPITRVRRNGGEKKVEYRIAARRTEASLIT